MDALVELFAAAVVTIAAAAFSHFGVSVERPEPPRASEAPAVRRSPVVVSRPRPLAECEKAPRLYA